MCRYKFQIFSFLITVALVCMTCVHHHLRIQADRLEYNRPRDTQQKRDLSRDNDREETRVALVTNFSSCSAFDRESKISERKTAFTHVNHHSNTNNTGYLIYACYEYMKCCGLGDRFKGIVTSYIFAKALNRTFGIDMTQPCDLRKFLKPNVIKWDIPRAKLRNYSSEFLELFDVRPKVRNDVIRENFTQSLTADVVKFHINQNYLPRLFMNPVVAQGNPEFASMPVNNIYRIILNDLFLPSDEIQSELKHYLKTYVNRSELVCAHIRIGKNPTMPDDGKIFITQRELEKIWKFLDTYSDTKKYRLYIATDAQDVKKTAIRRYGDQFKDTPGVIGHVDFVNNSRDGCIVLHKSILEYYLLTKCDVLLTTASGYGIIAAYQRKKNRDLYCLLQGVIIPCCMETLHLVYPVNRF